MLGVEERRLSVSMALGGVLWTKDSEPRTSLDTRRARQDRRRREGNDQQAWTSLTKRSNWTENQDHS
jgi:hypothetical protein